MVLNKNIAITGTKGKTTILSLLENSLISSGFSVVSSSSTEGLFHNKTFMKYPRFNNYLKAEDNDNVEIIHDYFISEATSYMLSKDFYDSAKVDIAIYTGIEMEEHLDVHKSFENYLRAKKRLFDFLPNDSIAIINVDDEHSSYIIKNCNANKIIRFGTQEMADYQYKISSITKRRMSINVCDSKGKCVEFKTRLLGKYNASNILASFIALSELGIDQKNAFNLLATQVGAFGRFQRLYLPNGNIIIIDYAHTPKSLENVLKLLHKIYPHKKIVTVFGAGGEKSKSKRPMMGLAAIEYSDEVIITSDNNRGEDFNIIAKDIVIDPAKYNIKISECRKDAIEYSINNYKNAIILIAGRGNEQYMEISVGHFEKYYDNYPKITDKFLDERNVVKLKLSDYSIISDILFKLEMKFIDSFYRRNIISNFLFP